MQNIGLKFKTVGRGLAERFVFIPRPRNVFSLFAKIPLPFLPPLPIFRVFTHLRFLTSVLFFSVFYARTRGQNFIYLEEREIDELFDPTWRLFPPFDRIQKFSIRTFSLRPNVGRNVNDLFEIFSSPFLLCPSSQWSTQW